MKVFISLVLSLALVACGSDKKGGSAEEAVVVTQTNATTGTETTSISKVYATASTLPTCSTSIEGQLAYVKDLAVFRYCERGAWITVDVSPDAPAKPPEVLTTVSNTTCHTYVTSAQATADGLDAGPASGFTLEYSVTRFSNAMIVVNGLVSAGLLQSSSVRTYTKELSGFATEASDPVTMDMAGISNFGFWSFSKTGQASQPYTVVYSDSNLTGAKTRTFTFLPTECTTTVY